MKVLWSAVNFSLLISTINCYQNYEKQKQELAETKASIKSSTVTIYRWAAKSLENHLFQFYSNYNAQYREE